MSLNKESVTIPKYTETRDDRDFDFLHRTGVEHIQALSRKLWTDYNSHDPGITILDVLCYAITDLGNRINQPIPDLLTKKGKKGELAGNFPTARQILTTKPVTEADYRKLFIDIDGVHNVFIDVNSEQILYRHCLEKAEPTEEEPQGKLSYDSDHSPDYRKLNEFALQGLYNIYFEPDHDIKIMDEDDEERKTRVAEIEEEIKRLYHANRNLCEDLAEVREVDYLDLLVCGDIELERTANAADVMAEILFRVHEYLSPSVKRYSLDDLLAQGLGVESIYEGPVLENGFIPDVELEKAAVKKEVHLSDLVRIVTETPGVRNIRTLKMGPCNGGEIPEDIRDKTKQKWTLCLPKDSVILPRLCTESSVRNTNLFKDVIPVPVDYEQVSDKMNTLIREHRESLTLSYDDIPAETGRYSDVEYYRSVQNDLPQLYGTGEYGLSPSLPPERHARAKQLKGYLLFFDQILATYFGHLHHVGDLLSAEVGSARSYYHSEVSEVKDFDELKKNAGRYDEDVQRILDSRDDFTGRKNAFLDHVLARFAENMNEYAFAMLDGFGEDLTSATLWHKSTLLREYPELSSRRACSFDYTADDAGPWDTRNVPGLKYRLARLLGIRNITRRYLTEYHFEIEQEDDDGEEQWRWRIFDQEEELLCTDDIPYDSKNKAEERLWKVVSLAWNPGNFDVRPGSEEEYHLILMDENGEDAARIMQIFDSEEEAKSRIEAIAEYMFTRVTEEGMFLFEHILFRPDRDDEEADQKFMKICMDSECSQCKPDDPYSLRLTIVFPGWTRRFSNLYFREYAERVIRREVPAHILCRICWIGNTKETEEGDITTDDDPMQELQELYKNWLSEKMESPDNQKENEFLKPLIDLLHDLVTVYPAGRLYDCGTGDTDEFESPIILGKSTIGELKKEDNGDE